MRHEFDSTRDRGNRLYIERQGSVHSREEYEQQAKEHQDAQAHEGGLWAQAMNVIFGDSRVRDDVRANLSLDANILAQGTELRPAPPMPNSYYQAVEHPEMHRMVHEGVDAGMSGEVGTLWKEAGKEMVDFQDQIAGAINNSETEWQGAAGDQARQFMADVGNWVGKAGSSAQLTGTNIELQADSVATAQRSMPAPVDFDLNAANTRLQQITDPFELIRQSAKDEAAFAAQKAAQQQAAQVMATYDGGLGSSTTMPAFAQPPVMGGGTPPPPVLPPPPGDGTARDGQTSVGDRTSGHTSTNNQIGTGNATAPTVGGRPGRGTQGQGFTGGPNVGGNPGPGLSGNNPAGQNPNAFGGTLMGPMGPMGGPGAGDTPRGGRGFGPTGGGARGGAGASAGRAGFGPGGSGGPGIGQQPGPGGRSGVGGIGGAAADQAMGRGGPSSGAAGARGAAGMGGMGAGAGKGQGGEDTEHQRPSYLVEADPDDLFGTDQMTAPSVIT